MQRSMNGRSAPPASAALIQELHDIVESDRYPFSPRMPTLSATLAKLDPPAPRPERLPPLKPGMGPGVGRGRRR
jgi:hypothetical protein